MASPSMTTVPRAESLYTLYQPMLAFERLSGDDPMPTIKQEEDAVSPYTPKVRDFAVFLPDREPTSSSDRKSVPSGSSMANLVHAGEAAQGRRNRRLMSFTSSSEKSSKFTEDELQPGKRRADTPDSKMSNRRSKRRVSTAFSMMLSKFDGGKDEKMEDVVFEGGKAKRGKSLKKRLTALFSKKF